MRDHTAMTQESNSSMTTTITVAITPNPNAKVFLANRTLVSANDHLELTTEDDVTERTPTLFAALIERADVRRVFVMNNFVTVVKASAAKWDLIEGELQEFIEEHLADFETLDLSDGPLSDDHSGIRQVIDSYLAPAIAVDGGAIRYHSFDPDTGVLTVTVLGSCHGCPSLVNTLQRGIKPMITELFPEVTDVVRSLG